MQCTSLSGIIYRSQGKNQGGESMKKAVCIVSLVLLILSCFTACTGQGYPVAVGECRISEGVYAYYVSVSENSDETLGLCKDFAAVKKLMYDEGISLSANYKRLVAEETDSKWSLFSAHYENIGVSKQDITEVFTAEYSKRELLDYYYGEKGKNPVSDKKLKEEFDSTYVGFKAIEASFMKLSDMGESVELSETEKKKLRNSFTSMADRINSGAMTIDDANVSYNESIGLIVTQSLETALTKEGDVLYGDNFFSEIKKLDKGEAGVIESGSSIYLLQRQTVTDDEDGYFIMYKAEILEKLKMPAIEKKLVSAAEEMQVKVNKRLSGDIAEMVTSIK